MLVGLSFYFFKENVTVLWLLSHWVVLVFKSCSNCFTVFTLFSSFPWCWTVKRRRFDSWNKVKRIKLIFVFQRKQVLAFLQLYVLLSMQNLPCGVGKMCVDTRKLYSWFPLKFPIRTALNSCMLFNVEKLLHIVVLKTVC